MREPHYVDPEREPWPVVLRSRLRNATILVVTVSSQLASLGALPRRYRRAYALFDLDAYVYAVPPLHWLLRAWNGYWRWGGRWVIERALIRAGLMDVEEDAFYRDAHWTPAFWRTHERRRQRYGDRRYSAGYQAGGDDLLADMLRSVREERERFERGGVA